MAWAIAASSFPDTGSPIPGGVPFAMTSTIPPTEFPESLAALISASISAGRFFPWTSMTRPVIDTPAYPSNFIATAPAATREIVSLPELRPPPLKSRMPYFTW